MLKADGGDQIELRNILQWIKENDLTEEIISRYRNTNIEMRKLKCFKHNVLSLRIVWIACFINIFRYKNPMK